MKSYYTKYPQLKNLLGKVPDEIIKNELRDKVPVFEYYASLAQDIICPVFLSDVFPQDAERGRITLDNFLGQWGNITVEEICKICLIAVWLKPLAVFEFGTFNGMTTKQFALNTHADCKIYTLDIPPQQSTDLSLGEIDGYLAQKKDFFHFDVGYYFKGDLCESKIIQLWGDSTKIDFSSFQGQFDIVFIDAGHTYPYVKADSENAFEMIRPGGVIIWHDYMQVLHPDVTRLLYEYAISGLKIHQLRSTSLAVYYDKGLQDARP